MRKYVRSLYKRVVPKPLRRKLAEYAKGAIAASGGVLIAINELAPEIAGQAQEAVTIAIAALTFVGVVRKRNRPQR